MMVYVNAWIVFWTWILVCAIAMSSFDDFVWWLEHDWQIDWSGPLDGPSRR